MSHSPPGGARALRWPAERFYWAVLEAPGVRRGGALPEDASVTLAGLLAAWPAEVPSRPQSLALTAESASVGVLVEGDPSAFVAALVPPKGWTMAEPRMNSAGEGASALWFAGARASAAHADLDREHAALASITAKAEEIDRLRRALPEIPPQAETSPLSERVPAVLASCGLPSSVLAGVAPGGEVIVKGPDGEPRAERTSATVNLRGLTLPQLGRVLEAWRESESGWVPVRLELAPLTGQKLGPAGGDLPLRVTMGLERLQMIEGAVR